MRRCLVISLMLACACGAQGQRQRGPTDTAMLGLMITSASTPALPITGLFAEYLFTTDSTDSSGNGYDLTMSAGGVITNGLFDATVSSYAYGTTGGETVRSFSYWIYRYFAFDAERHCTIDLDNSGAFQMHGHLGSLNAAIPFETMTVITDVNHVTYMTNTYSLGWHHVCVTASAAVYDAIYIDGILVDTPLYQGGGAVANGPALTICAANYLSSYRYHLNAPIDDVRLYSVELNAEDAEALYNYGRIE